MKARRIPGDRAVEPLRGTLVTRKERLHIELTITISFGVANREASTTPTSFHEQQLSYRVHGPYNESFTINRDTSTHGEAIHGLFY